MADKKYLNVRELGNGWFCGTMSGHSFRYEGKNYFVEEFGVRGINIPMTLQICNGEVKRV